MPRQLRLSRERTGSYGQKGAGQGWPGSSSARGLPAPLSPWGGSGLPHCTHLLAALHHGDGQAAPGDPRHGRGAAPGWDGAGPELLGAGPGSGEGAPRGAGSHEASCVQIQPDLRELMETMHRMSHLPPDFEGRQTVSQW